MIDVMRRQIHPGSDIVIEETLGPGSNYDRYVVSYLSEGLKIYALLTVPRGERPSSGWPVIVFNHGYIPPAQYRTTERYGSYVDGFARNGYIVLKPDYRGHGSSEGEPAGAFTSPAYTVDVLNAVGSMERYPDADPARIGMWGHSMGGTLTVRAMVVTDDIKAGVIWAGVVAPIEDVWEERQEWIVNHLTATPDPGGTPGPPSEGVFARGWFDQNPAFWTAVDPVYHLEDLSGPIQLHHGTGDTTVPLAFSEDFHDRLEAAGQPGELYRYEGDNHNLTNQFGTVMERSVAFFDVHVKNDTTASQEQQP
jgi:dipeptidyl aminopeptidase/acylaminoacyl peptidase